MAKQPKNTPTKRQDSPHREGAQNNIPGQGQVPANNRSAETQDMIQESEEQLRGRQKELAEDDDVKDAPGES